MPVSIVVGGQFGSEGKGKVALEVARRSREPVILARVGGPNSGHTAYGIDRSKYVLRQMPAASIDRKFQVVFPAGSYLDVDILLREITLLSYPSNLIMVSPAAAVILPEHREWEQTSGLISGIGSTGSGVGAAVVARVARGSRSLPLQFVDAQHVASLQPFIRDTTALLRDRLNNGYRVIVEGTQGFGLSLYDGGYWPKATARATTASGALSEVGLSPLDVDDVTLVIRSFPIRVAGASGPLVGETTWENVAALAQRSDDLREFTTVTRALRRVGHFDPEIVRRALAANNPSRLVLNHLDYVGAQEDLMRQGSALNTFLSKVESSVGRRIDWYGFDGFGVVPAKDFAA